MHKVVPIQHENPWIAGEKIHARAVNGPFARWRWAFVWLTQIAFYGVPWLSWNARQAALFDLEGKRFYLFGAVLFPQDLIYLAALLVISALLLFFATAVVGRVWCGFACPQTVYTSIFMWIENNFEGSHQNRKRLDTVGWGPEKLLRRGGKHLAWALFGLWTGFTFVGYFTAIRPLAADVLSLSVGPWTTFWILFYGLLTYLNAGLVREKVCLHMCPYGRFQGALMDERTLNVAYDHRRGEPRRGRVAEDHRKASDGHCIDCTLCVQVCPTGIDIRQGLQAACIGCGLCIDACDDVMRKVQAPKGLIRMASLHELGGAASKQRAFLQRVLRTRVGVYASLLSLAIAATITAFAHRPEVRMNIIRDRSIMTRQVEQGAVENVYTLQLMNASDHTRTVVVDVAPSNLVALRTPITARLGPAQATTLTATVRMPAAEAAQHAGEVVHIRFLVTTPQQAGTAEVNESSTFLVPR
ncbi:cytochrome c oxidase accessory protein CcoG [Hydrogenophaga sp. NFH-34]|uniref:cytochrome c oxidase accessory protein CcoG n=1 Tax=Hydrogenophaga sp. NFH-34 TaxID=2744446 RepID=UPI001F2D9ED5|nr:cytochrome c oxidase accessory protein CcoG [Hydrogenophaga sp. NFH-34]